MAHVRAATRPHAPQDHNARENCVEHGMSMIHQRPIDILTGTFGTVRHIDVRTAAGGDLSRMPLCHRVLLENVLRSTTRTWPSADGAALLDWLEPGTQRGRDPVPARPHPDARHDLHAGAGRHRRHARRAGRGRRRPGAAQPGLPGATSRSTTRWRSTASARPMRSRCNMAHEMRPQRRALPLHALGGEGAARRPRPPARHRHHAHHQPGAAGHRRHARRSATACAGRCPTR